ncbi:MAG: glycosyltransferase family 4 protein [Chloroflexota bacterium]
MKSSKPIGIVTPRYPPAIGGVEYHVSQLAEGLAARGIVVRVITTDPTGKLPPFEKQGLISISRFPTIRNDDVYFLSPKLAKWLSANGDRFALLHAHSYHTPLAFITANVCRQNKIPFIFSPHYHGTGHTGFRRLLHIPYRPFGRWTIRRAGRVVCVSEMEKRLIHQDFGSDLPTLVVPNGVDLKAIAEAEPFPEKDTRKYILFVGRLEQYKQTENLIDVLPHLPEEYDLVIIGNGPMRKALEQKAKKLAVTPRVHMMRQVSQENLLSWYKTADVFVSLSQHEAFGMVVLEALAAGTPAVASDIPSHMELAHYVPPGRLSYVGAECTPEELASTLQQAAARGRQEKMPNDTIPTWEKVVDVILAQYFSLLRGP